MEHQIDRVKKGVGYGIRLGVVLLIATVFGSPRAQTATPADQLIFRETFERGSLETQWRVFDQNALNGLDTWGIVECRVHSGSAAVWCRGSTRQDCSQYDGGMTATMETVKDLDLGGYAGAHLTYWRWYNLPETAVTFSLYVRDNSHDWQEVKSERVQGTAAPGGWIERTVSLASYGAGFRMRFMFVSLAVPSGGEQTGVYLDDIEITGCPILGPAVAISPVDSVSVCSGQSQDYCWSAVPGASLYRVQWSETTASPPIGEATTTDTCLARALPGIGVRFWRVRAETSCSQGAWSAWAFCVLVPVPGKPSLVSPDDHLQVCSGTSHRYDWTSVADATAYTIQWDRLPSFPAPTEDEVTASQIDRAIVSTAGTWYWRVRARTGLCAGPWSQDRSIEVRTIPLQVVLDAPSDGAFRCAGTSVHFAWDAQAGAEIYDLQRADNPAFSGGEVVTKSTKDTDLVETGLSGYGTRFWRVRARNECGDGPWSEARRFELGIVPGAPVLQSPVSGESVCSDQSQIYCWVPSPGASSYRIQWADTSAFDHFVLEDTSNDACAVRILSGTGTRYWRVRAESACGYSPWSAVRSVTLVKLSVPGKAVLLAPAEGAAVCSGIDVNYCWEPAARTQTYRVQWNETSEFTSPLERTTVSRCELMTIAEPGRWFWRVRAENLCSAGPWSDVRQVKIAELAPFRCLGVSWTVAGDLSVQWEEQPCNSAYTIEISTDLSDPAGWIPIPPVTQWPVSGGSWTGPPPPGLDHGFLRIRAER